MLAGAKGGYSPVLTVVCFLWQDPEFQHRHLFTYDARYVNVLRSMLARHLTVRHQLVCCTDDPAGIDPGVRIVPLPAEAQRLGSYNRKLYIFHPDAGVIFGKRILMLDLDVVLVGNIDDIASRPEPFLAWAGHLNGRNRFNTSLVLMDGGAFPEVWTDFDPGLLASLKDHGFDGLEQDWVSHKIGGRGAAIPRTDVGIESFTPLIGKPLPGTARIVFFNGRSSPPMAKCQAVAWCRENWG